METLNNKFITISAKETEKLGESFAKHCLRSKSYIPKPIILSLEGDLGGGKTTFTKGFARGLGIKENIKSPTFTIMKKFPIPNSHNQNSIFKIFYHFDCYRIEKPKEILNFGFKEIIENPQNIIIFEWGDKIKKILPKDYIEIKFEFLDENKRKITIEYASSS